jgi:pimeloyl-ACP methyl ester carboxylesterase
MKDIAFREQELNKWTELFPEARVEKLETVGHYVQEEATEDFYCAVEEFLRESP